jgi:hypothetical protein
MLELASPASASVYTAGQMSTRQHAQLLLFHTCVSAAVQADLRYEGARAVLRVAGVRGQHLHEALAAFNSGRMCAFRQCTIASGMQYTAVMRVYIHNCSQLRALTWWMLVGTSGSGRFEAAVHVPRSPDVS